MRTVSVQSNTRSIVLLWLLQWRSTLIVNLIQLCLTLYLWTTGGATKSLNVLLVTFVFYRSTWIVALDGSTNNIWTQKILIMKLCFKITILIKSLNFLNCPTSWGTNILAKTEESSSKSSCVSNSMFKLFRMLSGSSLDKFKAIGGGVRVKIFILSYLKELHWGEQRLFTECQN